MKSGIFKRGMTMLLALVLCLSTFAGLGTTAFAADTTDEVYLVSFPREGDESYNGEWGHGSYQFKNGWKSGTSRFTTVRAMGSYEGNICYCIEPGVPQNTGDSYIKKGENFWSAYPGDYNDVISPDDIKQFIGRIMQYGYSGTITASWRSQNEGGDKLAQAVATQFLIWETVVGERDSDFQKVGTGGKDAVLNQLGSGHPLRAKIMSYYNQIAKSVQEHSKLPSFLSKSAGKAQNIELEWNGSEYTATLTDTNHVLDNYTFSSGTAGIRFSINGNKLTITAKTAPTETVSITAEKKNSKRSGVITWTDGVYGPNGKLQDTVTYAESVNDPIKGYVNIKVSYGSAKIVKTSEDGVVDGISFRIQGNGVDKTVQTKNGGQIQIDNLYPGIYSITEQSYEKYEPQETRRVTVVSGQTSTVTFNNKLKRGHLEVIKTSEDNMTEGIKFHLYGTSLSGLAVDEYAVTNASGVASFQDVLISGNTPYTLEEVDTDIKYVVPARQTAAVEWNKVTSKGFHNILKKWSLTATKSDSEKGRAQGDASLAGAKYGIYKGSQLIDTYTTDKNGQFTTKSYVCGDNWSLREISPSEGYLLNTESLHIGAEAKLYKAEFNLTQPLDSYETVKKGKIAVIKHCDDGSTQIETPEAGAEFEVFLKAAGSYGTAKATERDILVCDEYGFAESKSLPYGIYTVKQTKGWDGKELLPSFDVFVNKDGEIYRYLMNNATFESLIEIVKKDIETGKVIPAAGIGFKVRDCATGAYIVQHINYPTPVDIDTYYTDSTGRMMMPEKLLFGQYELIEQCTAYGYVLDSAPIPFKVDGSETVVTVEKHNIAQKGTITVGKSGEVFSSVVETDGIYQPLYDTAGLSGAVYEVYADEDILTLDGTVRAKKGDLVSTIETGANGYGTSSLLYLGKYKIVEKKAPYTMVINTEPKFLELTYAGETVQVTETETAFYNERQRAEISLSKIMEQNELFGIGMEGEILSVQFGLFAAEDLTAADGLVIPKDGLIEIISCDENGKATFATDIPVGAKLYVKELTADEHYILSDEKYPVVFDYEGQETALVEIKVNDSETIKNKIIYGTIKGMKIDRETEETIAGALFGLFRADETEFTEKTAVLTAESKEDGIFTFENVPFGNWLVKELRPAEGFLPNDEVYTAVVRQNAEMIEIRVVNDRVPEIGTLASVEGTKEVCATEVFTLEDTVRYKHLIPGKEYMLKGVLMDKNTGKALLINGEEIRSNASFIPEEPSGEIIVKFTFDSRFIKEDTEIVVFESLYKDGKELAVHADIEDAGQTVTVKVPEIGTQATAEGQKEIVAKGKIMIEDTVSYKNLTVGKEYVLKGILMDKATGKPFIVDDKKITAEAAFTPETAEGETTVSFTFHADGITKDTDIVVFESLHREGVEIAVHADINDGGQTVKLIPPVSEIPQTGDSSNLGFWIGLGAVALGGVISIAIILIKKKKDDDDE